MSNNGFHKAERIEQNIMVRCGVYKVQYSPSPSFSLSLSPSPSLFPLLTLPSSHPLSSSLTCYLSHLTPTLPIPLSPFPSPFPLLSFPFPFSLSLSLLSIIPNNRISLPLTDATARWDWETMDKVHPSYVYIQQLISRCFYTRRFECMCLTDLFSKHQTAPFFIEYIRIHNPVHCGKLTVENYGMNEYQ